MFSSSSPWRMGRGGSLRGWVAGGLRCRWVAAGGSRAVCGWIGVRAVESFGPSVTALGPLGAVSGLPWNWMTALGK